MYKVYGNSKINGWEVVANKKSLVDAKKIANRLTADEYYSYLIKESDENGDRIIRQETLKEETEKEKVKSFKEKYKVKEEKVNDKYELSGREKPKSRMKKKEELMKEVRDYIDR